MRLAEFCDPLRLDRQDRAGITDGCTRRLLRDQTLENLALIGQIGVDIRFEHLAPPLRVGAPGEKRLATLAISRRFCSNIIDVTGTAPRDKPTAKPDSEITVKFLIPGALYEAFTCI